LGEDAQQEHSDEPLETPMAHREPEPQPGRPKGVVAFAVAIVVVMAIVLVYFLLRS
jgi:hypothetical protein